MNSRRIVIGSLYFALIVSLSLSQAVAAESKTFSEALHDYHKAFSSLKAGLLSTDRFLQNTLEGTPDAETIKQRSDALNDRFQEANSAFQALEKAGKNASKNQEAILMDIKENGFKKHKETIQSVTESYQEFSNNIQNVDFSVYAHEAWANSGISVSEGDIIAIEPEGQWQASSNYDPTGYRGYLCESDSYALNTNAPMGSLLYRVRGSENRYGQALNEDKKGQADASGRLEFIMNDEDRDNNLGQLNLKVAVMDLNALRTLLENFKSLKDS